MSQATTASDEAQLPESDASDFSHLHGSTGVLSMNGEEIELSYSDVMDLRSALIREAWRAEDEDRPNTAGVLKEIRDTFGPAVGR